MLLTMANDMNSPIDAKVAARLAAIAAACEAAGWQVGARRPVQYGAQFSVADGGRTASVTVYGGKKGISVVVGGPPASPLREALTRLIDAAPAAPAPRGDARPTDFGPGPWLGSDESGKGDYFGPLVVAAVFVAPEQESALRSAGVRDSKLLDDEAARRIAAEVRRLCSGRCAEEELQPEAYNARYAALRARGENLNHLLADLHVRAIAAVLERLPAGASPLVIADQFADERLVRTRLLVLAAARRQPAPRLVQAPRAEANVAVAAASILARDRFLATLANLGEARGVALPKGGSKPEIIAAARRVVASEGAAALGTIAKLHFATTRSVLGASD
jgi:ribonuclease HIII